jgi:hypothetical protein
MVSGLTTQTCGPLQARQWFKLREVVNWAVSLGLFVVIFLVLMPILHPFFALVIGVIPAACLLFLLLDKRAIGIRCNRCLKYIATNTPWVCGFCQATNQRVDDFPFVYRCEHCGAEPKAYKCHHCGELVFLSEDRLGQNYARCVSTPVEDVSKVEISLQDREKRRMEHELLMTRLTAELNDAKRKVEPPKKVGPLEKLEEDFSIHHTRVMGAREIARREKAANAEKYKDDPAGLKDANDAVDDWLSRHI